MGSENRLPNHNYRELTKRKNFNTKWRGFHIQDSGKEFSLLLINKEQKSESSSPRYSIAKSTSATISFFPNAVRNPCNASVGHTKDEGKLSVPERSLLSRAM